MTSDILSFLQDLGAGNIVRALLLLIVCLIVSRWVLRLTRKALSQVPNLEPTTGFILQRALLVLLILITLMSVISAAGVPITSFVALFSVVGVSVSLAAQGVLSNVISGILIMFARPFRIGDHITISDTAGQIEGIGFLYTKIRMGDNQAVFLPNSLANSSIIINSDEAGIRRADIAVSASYDNSPEEVRHACLEAVSKFEDVLQDPAPTVRLTSYGDSNINYSVRIWAKVEKYWDVYFGVSEEIYNSFARNHVEMSYPQSVIELKKN